MIGYSWILENRGMMQIIFTVAMALICAVIVFKTHRIFQLSFHEGVRYFRNAFFFYGLAFIAKFLSGEVGKYCLVMTAVYEFFMIMAGFFLLYSLLCRNFITNKPSFSSLFNWKIFIFYTMALIIGSIDALWGVYHFMFISQIIVFSFAAGIAFSRYKENTKSPAFLKLYLIVILLNLASWTLNFIVGSFFEWNVAGLIALYILNLFTFLLFLYSVIIVTRK